MAVTSRSLRCARYFRAITLRFTFKIILVINMQIVVFLLHSYYLRKLWGGERALIREGHLFDIMAKVVSQRFSGDGRLLERGPLSRIYGTQVLESQI